VRYALLPALIAEEGTSFHRVRQTWMPNGLLPDPHRRNLLRDIRRRYERLSAAENELRSLKYGERYIGYLRDMRQRVREADFTWNVDDLRYFTAIVKFYTSYGRIYQMLRHEKIRGRFDTPTPL
jgi:hypothetical protein